MKTKVNLGLFIVLLTVLLNAELLFAENLPCDLSLVPEPSNSKVLQTATDDGSWYRLAIDKIHSEEEKMKQSGINGIELYTKIIAHFEGFIVVPNQEKFAYSIKLLKNDESFYLEMNNWYEKKRLHEEKEKEKEKEQDKLWAEQRLENQRIQDEKQRLYKEKQEKEELKQIAKFKKTGNPVAVISGEITIDSANVKYLDMSVRNVSKKSIDAYQVQVLCYDRYGKPVRHYVYRTNIFKGQSQTVISPDGYDSSSWYLHGFDLVSEARIRIISVHYQDGSIWKRKTSEYDLIVTLN